MMGASHRQLGLGKRLLQAWWVFKKLAWRNTAGLFWLTVLVGIASVVRGTSFPCDLKSIGSRDGLLVLVLWFTIITEAQITQLMAFLVYTLSLPLWLPMLCLYHYFRSRIKLSPTPPTGSVVNLRSNLRRFLLPGILIALALSWPFPSRTASLILGALVLWPASRYLAGVFRFCVAPTDWAVKQREWLLDKYNFSKKMLEVDRDGLLGWVRSGLVLVISLVDRSAIRKREAPLLRAAAILVFLGHVAMFFAFVGLIGALWLIALLPGEAELAAALGSQHLPNLPQLALAIVMEDTGVWTVSLQRLSGLAWWLVLLLRLAKVAVSVALVGVFSSGVHRDFDNLNAVDDATDKAEDEAMKLAGDVMHELAHAGEQPPEGGKPNGGA